MSKVFEILKPPFRYDDYGQMIFDSNNNLVLDVRAWGKLQYKNDGERLQDEFGRLTCDGLNFIAQPTNTAKKLLAETLIDPYFRNKTHMAENCNCLECRIKAFLKVEEK